LQLHTNQFFENTFILLGYRGGVKLYEYRLLRSQYFITFAKLKDCGRAYKALEISTIVDTSLSFCCFDAYKALEISTIVDTST